MNLSIDYLLITSAFKADIINNLLLVYLSVFSRESNPYTHHHVFVFITKSIFIFAERELKIYYFTVKVFNSCLNFILLDIKSASCFATSTKFLIVLSSVERFKQ